MESTNQFQNIIQRFQEAIKAALRQIFFMNNRSKYTARQEWLRRQRLKYSLNEEEPTVSTSTRSRSETRLETLDERVELIVNKFEALKAKTPSSPEFLGEELEYPERKYQFFRFSRPLPDLMELRDELDAFSKIEKVSNLRKKITKALKYHPYNAEIRAIKGIQVFNDTLQSGLDEKKMDVLQSALTEISLAIYNEAISIYHVNWLIKIYVKYLEMLQRKILAEYNANIGNFHWRVQKVGEELHKLLIQITSMLTIKNQLTGLSMLNAKLKGSAYIYDCLSKSEIRAAAASLKSGENRTVGVGKSSNYILWEIFTLTALFARIPIFRKLVTDILNSIPDTSKTLVLQKNLVATVTAVADYQNALAMGDINKKIETAFRIFNRCANTISQHLSHVSPTRVYEVDPFLKAAWITKESNGLFERSEYRKMLEQSLSYLNTVIQNQDSVKGSYELAKQLQDDILDIMGEHGWSSF